MTVLTVKLQNFANLENLKINDVACSTDSKGMRHSNQYLNAKGSLYTYKEYVNYLVKRFKYDQVVVSHKGTDTIIWTKKTKENIFSVDLKDIQTLYLHTKHAYKGLSFELWQKQTEKNYLSFIKGKENFKNFSQWINGQILSLT